MGTPKEEALGLADFPQTDKGKIASCPQGYAPIKIKVGKQNAMSVVFDSEHCCVCPSGNSALSNPGRRAIIFASTSRPCESPGAGPGSTPRSSRTSTAGARESNRPFRKWTKRQRSNDSEFEVCPLWATVRV